MTVKAQQVYGGHGYIREWGIEQLMRDSRITQLYEGTNGIQALDYIRRKLLGDGGAELSALQAEFSEVCDRQIDRPAWGWAHGHGWAGRLQSCGGPLFGQVAPAKLRA